MCFSDLMSSPVKNKQKQTKKTPLLMIQQLLARAPFLFEGLDPFCEWKPFSNQSKLHQSATYPPGRVQYGYKVQTSCTEKRGPFKNQDQARQN